MIGYHFSIKEIQIGDIITSHQHHAARWKFAYPIYREEFLKRGLILSPNYGYAYEQRQMHASNLNLYRVESPDASCIKGNPNFSLYYLLDCRVKDPLAIKEWANKYLDEKSDRTEIISDKWRVIERLND